MTDDVTVPFGEDQQDTAILLLAAAQELDLPADVVKVTTDGEGGFLVPEEVRDKAGLGDEKKPAKKAAAKKTASKDKE